MVNKFLPLSPGHVPAWTNENNVDRNDELVMIRCYCKQDALLLQRKRHASASQSATASESMSGSDSDVDPGSASSIDDKRNIKLNGTGLTLSRLCGD